MDSIGKITLKNNRHDNERIGELKRQKHADESLKIEEIVEKHCPLTCSFDIRPIQDYYFKEFSYYDFLGGIFLISFNQETNVRLLQKCLEDDSYPVEDVCRKIKEYTEDKYVLQKDTFNQDVERLVVLPGSNMVNAPDKSRFVKLLHENDDIYIKPHPLSNQQYLRHLGVEFGYWRMVENRDSFIPYLYNAEEFWYTQNSELGFVVTAWDKKAHDITNVMAAAALTYYPIYYFFNEDLQHNKNIINKLFSCPYSGILMPWNTDNDQRVQDYYQHAMEYRKFFKPMTITYDRTLFQQKAKAK